MLQEESLSWSWTQLSLSIINKWNSLKSTVPVMENTRQISLVYYKIFHGKNILGHNLLKILIDLIIHYLSINMEKSKSCPLVILLQTERVFRLYIANLVEKPSELLITWFNNSNIRILNKEILYQGENTF